MSQVIGKDFLCIGLPGRISILFRRKTCLSDHDLPPCWHPLQIHLSPPSRRYGAEYSVRAYIIQQSVSRFRTDNAGEWEAVGSAERSWPPISTRVCQPQDICHRAQETPVEPGCETCPSKMSPRRDGSIRQPGRAVLLLSPALGRAPGPHGSASAVIAPAEGSIASTGPAVRPASSACC